MKASSIHFKKSSLPVCFQTQKEFFHENKKTVFLFYWMGLNFMLPLFQCVILLIAICKNGVSSESRLYFHKFHIELRSM